MDITFSPRSDGSKELLIDNKNSGLFFHTINGNKIEDYNFELKGEKFSHSTNAHFTIAFDPSPKRKIILSPSANIHFDGDINITVRENLYIGKNEGLTISSDKPVSLSYAGLVVKDNINTTVKMVKENPRETSIAPEKITITNTTISNNSNSIFEIGTEVRAFDLSFNRAIYEADYFTSDSNEPFKLSILGADYAIVSNSNIASKDKDASLKVDVNGAFLLNDTNLILRGKNYISNNYAPTHDKKEFISTLISAERWVDFKNMELETNSIKFSMTNRGEDGPIKVEGKLKIDTDKAVDIREHNDLKNLSISCPNSKLILKDNRELHNSTISFVLGREDAVGGNTIHQSNFHNAKITNIEDDLCLAVMSDELNKESLVVDHIFMRSGAIRVDFNQQSERQLPLSYPITLNNVRVEAHSKLYITMFDCDFRGNAISAEINNTTFEGVNQLSFAQPFLINNSLFDKATYVSFGSDSSELHSINNLIAKNRVELHNVKNVECCDLDTITIDDEKGIKLLKDEAIVKENIKDYDFFCKNRGLSSYKGEIDKEIERL